MKKKYIPINCGFHDQLLDRITRRSFVKLEYVTNGTTTVKNTIFKDIYTHKKEEFILLKNGEIIRLDHIISIDGIQRPESNYTRCKV